MLTNACDATAIWYYIAAPGYNTYKNQATVTISRRPVAVKSRDVSKSYDGTPLKLTATDIEVDNLVEGESFIYGDFAEQTAVGEATATFTVSAGENTRLTNYNITTEFGKITVTRAAVGPDGGGDEPGGGDVPEGGLSKFDAEAVVYDGKGHTINTNALVAAFNAAMTGAGETAFAYALDDGTGASGGAGRAALL